MSYTVDKTTGGRIYRYLVTGYREKSTGKVKHRSEYLGRVIEDERGRRRLKPKRSGEVMVEEILPFGDLALVYDTADQLDFVETIDKLARRESSTSTGKALLVLTLNHLVGRVALDEIASWYWRSMLRYWLRDPAETFTEERLLGALDAVCREEEDLMRDKTWIITQAFRRRVEELWGRETEYAYYDRTQVTYNGESCYWAEFSHAHGVSKNRKKIGVGIVVRRGDGFPVLYRTYRGNKVDVSTVAEVVSRLKAAGLRKLILVMDRGMASEDNVKELIGAGYGVVIGVSEREKVFGELLSSLTDDELERPDNRLCRAGRVFCAVERIVEVEGSERKFVIYQDPRVRGVEKAGLLHALSVREEKLRDLQADMEAEIHRRRRGRTPDWKKRVESILGGMGRFFNWRLERGRLEWEVKNDEVADAFSKLARCMLMSTDVSIPKEELVRVYLDKAEAEKVWRVSKGVLGLKGIKHWKRDRVVAYLLVCYLAYLLWVAIRQRLGEKRLDLSPDKALTHLRRVEVVRFRIRGRERFELPRAVGIEADLQEQFGLERWKLVVPI